MSMEHLKIKCFVIMIYIISWYCCSQIMILCTNQMLIPTRLYQTVNFSNEFALCVKYIRETKLTK